MSNTPLAPRAPLLRACSRVRAPVAKILKYFPPIPGTCTPGSPGSPEALSCGPRECSSHLQLPPESRHLATEGHHLGAVRGCRLALQRLFKTDDLLGELCDLQQGGGVSGHPGPTAGGSGERSRTGHILAVSKLQPVGREWFAPFYTAGAGVKTQRRNAVS